jgi:nitroreductase
MSILTVILFIMGFNLAQAQELRAIQLVPPNLNRTGTMMQALLNRQAIREFNSRMLSDQDLSDLLWAANGVNRPDTGGRTAATGGNSQDIDIYVIMAQGTFLYNAQNHSLEPIVAGDLRGQVIPRQANVATAPVSLLLVSDTARFPQTAVTPAPEVTTSLSGIHAGIVAQNISLFCASAGLVTVITGAIIHTPEEFKRLLRLTPYQRVMVNLPVGYPR